MKCEFCHIEFKTYPSQKRKFCSKDCYVKNQIGKPTWNKNFKGAGYRFKGKIIKNNCKCGTCGKKFHLKPCAIKRGRGNYCCHPCYWKARKEFMKGKNNPQYDQHWGKGEGNVNWRGGISQLPYHFTFTKDLKYEIKKRDGFECSNCHIPERQHRMTYGAGLTIHHIDYNKFNCEESNLITVCKVCNSRANFKRDWWYRFFTSIISEKEVSK